MTPGLSGRASGASYWPITASSASWVCESVPDFGLRAGDPSASLLLHRQLIQGPAAAAHARRWEADDVLMTACEPDVEACAFQDAEQLSATRATPFTFHRACPPVRCAQTNYVRDQGRLDLGRLQHDLGAGENSIGTPSI